MSASQAISMTPAQVRAVRRLAAGLPNEMDINGSIVIYQKDYTHDLEFVWSDFAGNLNSVFILPDGTTREGVA